jgi:hypothetical protein
VSLFDRALVAGLLIGVALALAFGPLVATGVIGGNGLVFLAVGVWRSFCRNDGSVDVSAIGVLGIVLLVMAALLFGMAVLTGQGPGG